MTLDELKALVDFKVEHLQDKQPSEVPVLITLAESSIGSRASCQVQHIGMGFDWEHGQLRIEPKEPLVRKGNALSDVKEVVHREFLNRKYYCCPTCRQKITKDDYYCRYCGQKLR